MLVSSLSFFFMGPLAFPFILHEGLIRSYLLVYGSCWPLKNICSVLFTCLNVNQKFDKSFWGFKVGETETYTVRVGACSTAGIKISMKTFVL